MRITYCKKCNRFFYSPTISNYCRGCKSPVIEVPMDYGKFLELSINERYRLAYRLTNEYDTLARELKENADRF